MEVIWYLSCDVSQIDLYNNSPNNAIVNAASNITYRLLLQAEVLKLFSRFFFYFMNYGIIIAQAKYNVHYYWQQKKLSVLDITGFFFRIRTQVKVLVLPDAISNTNRFNSTVSYT